MAAFGVARARAANVGTRLRLAAFGGRLVVLRHRTVGTGRPCRAATGLKALLSSRNSLSNQLASSRNILVVSRGVGHGGYRSGLSRSGE